MSERARAASVSGVSRAASEAGVDAAGRAVTAGKQLLSTLKYDWAMIVLFTWFLAGVYVDGWGHNHEETESFFTPYHFVLYSGFAAVAILTLWPVSRNTAEGYRWRDAIPAGYELSVLGVIIFATGGLADMIWHISLGVEVGIEPLLSPPHLLLMFGGVLIAPGPLRAAWHRQLAGVQPPGWLAQMPMLLSWFFLYSGLTFITNYLSPIGVTVAAENFFAKSGEPAESAGFGIASVMVQSAILMSVVLLMLKCWRWRLPTGSLVILLTLNTTIMVYMKTHLVTTGEIPMIVMAFIAGIAGEALLWWLRPDDDRPIQLRVFAFAFPAILYTLYFGLIATAGDGIVWTTPAWTGTIVLAGAIGLLLSYLVMPTPLMRMIQSLPAPAQEDSP